MNKSCKIFHFLPTVHLFISGSVSLSSRKKENHSFAMFILILKWSAAVFFFSKISTHFQYSSKVGQVRLGQTAALRNPEGDLTACTTSIPIRIPGRDEEVHFHLIKKAMRGIFGDWHKIWSYFSQIFTLVFYLFTYHLSIEKGGFIVLNTFQLPLKKTGTKSLGKNKSF